MKIKIIKKPKIIDNFFKSLLNISLLIKKIMRPITRTTELKNLVCGRKKLEQYEINKSENIP